MNEGLINCYNQIKNNIEDLISNLDLLNTEFTSYKNTEGQRGQPNNIDISTYKLTREHYYYWIRNEYNNNEKNNSLSAASFLFPVGFILFFVGNVLTICVKDNMRANKIKNVQEY